MATTSPDIDLGRGLYAAGEIERFVALHLGVAGARRSQDWLRDVVEPVDHATGRPDYSFNDLISVFAVAELRRHHVSLQRIRRAKSELRKLLGIEQPLALDGLYTDGDYVFADLGVSGQLTNLNRGGQEAHHAVLALKLERVRFEQGARMPDRPARAWSPMEGVCVDPAVQFGAPCVEGRRVPTSTLVQLASEGASVEDLAFEFRLGQDEVSRALVFEARLAAAI